MANNITLTARQENGSKVFFEAILEHNVTDYSRLREIVAGVYPNVNASWMDTYTKQATALVDYLKKSGTRRSGFVYSREDPSGFMVFILTIALHKCGVSNPNRWNPADIYMVLKSEEHIIRSKIIEITNDPDMEVNLRTLNAYMRDLLNEGKLIPISLKALKTTTTSAKAEKANAGGPKHEYDFKLKKNSVKCILSMGNKNAYEFDTGEFAFDFYVGDEEIHGQSRNFQYSKDRNLVQTDLTPKGRSAGAKLGKVSSTAIDTFLSTLNLVRPSSPVKDPNIDPNGKWTDENIQYWINFQKELSTRTIDGNHIDFGNLTVKTDEGVLKGMEHIMTNAVKWEGATRMASGRFTSKLIGLRWCYVWAEIDKMGKLDDWLKTLYYGAKKEFSDLNGPFLKIY